MAKKKKAKKKATVEVTGRRKKVKKKPDKKKTTKKRKKKAAPNSVDKNFEVPSLVTWRKKTSRKSILNKLPLMVSIKFAFELAAREILQLPEENLKMPPSHLKTLVAAYQTAVGLDPPVEPFKNKEGKKEFSRAEFPAMMKKFHKGQIVRIDGRYVEIEGPIQKLYFRNCFFPFKVDGQQYNYEYRSIRIALELAANESRISQVGIWETVSNSAQLCYGDFPWDEQIKTLSSLIATHETFGHVDDFAEQLVLNDWLEEHGMPALLFPQIALSAKKK